MRGLNRKILEYAQQLPEGAPLTAKGLLHLGSRAAVDQALKRLVGENKLIRAMRGVYYLPVTSRFGTASPSVGLAISGLATALGETIVPNGAASANSLGLTTQVPIRRVYFVSGKSRKLNFGKRVVELQHAEPWLLAPGREGQAVRALEWLGENEAPRAMRKLTESLSSEELGNLVIAAANLPPAIAHEVRSAACPLIS